MWGRKKSSEDEGLLSKVENGKIWYGVTLPEYVGRDGLDRVDGVVWFTKKGSALEKAKQLYAPLLL